MPTTFNLPSLDDVSNEATVERYFQPVGTQVRVGQPIAVVLTERFEWEIPSTATGTISAIMAEPGTTVAIGAPLLQIEVGDTAAVAVPAQQPATIPRATPVARRIAAVHGLSLPQIMGSGRGGRITRYDVLSSLPSDATTIVMPPANGQAENITGPSLNTRVSPVTPPVVPNMISPADIVTTPPVTAVAETQIVAAWPACTSIVPTVVTAVEVDMTAVLTYIEDHAARLKRRSIQLTKTACIAQAVVTSLGVHRLFNSAWHDDGLIVWQRIDLGVMQRAAEATTYSMITNTADLSLQGLARALSEPTNWRTTSQPTFSLNIGQVAFWGEQLMNPGQGAALYSGAIVRRPIVITDHGIDTIVLRPMSILSLSYDGRVAHQEQADALLLDIKNRLEHFAALC